MSTEQIKVPDLGGADNVEVIELCIAVGDRVTKEQSLVVLESDKASMEVPSPVAGKITGISIKVGDKVSEGAVIAEVAVDGAEPEVAVATAATPVASVEVPVPAPAPAVVGGFRVEQVLVPDTGGAAEVEVIELCLAEGADVSEGESLVVLETDKASMELPAPVAGRLIKLLVKEGDKVAQGAVVAEIQVATTTPVVALEPEKPSLRDPVRAPAVVEAAHQAARLDERISEARPSKDVYAGPAVRKLARELGIDLANVVGQGPRGRIAKEDLQNYVKQLVQSKGNSVAPIAASGAGIPKVPEIDFSQFGPVDIKPLSRLHMATAANMHRSWLNVPHVTQFDDVDITDLEDFRSSIKAEAEKKGVKLTPLPFLLKACALALRANPKFNASLHADGENMVYKNYVHIGMAVDTPAGLVVPVIRDVDQKSIFELAAETAELAAKAKDRKLKPQEMQGGCFTISSLGNIGGTGFTPIVNAPEVGILGVSKLAVKPHWDGKNFVPRKMLPVCLSYDHRAVNGGDAGRFLTQIGELLSDIRRLVL